MKKRYRKMMSMILCSAMILTVPAESLWAEETDFVDLALEEPIISAEDSEEVASVLEPFSEELDFTDFVEEVTLSEEMNAEESYTEEKTEQEEQKEENTEDVDFIDEAFLPALASLEVTGEQAPVCTMDPSVFAGADSDELFKRYANQALYFNSGVELAKTFSRDTLTKNGSKIYDLVKKQILKIADGTRSSTSIAFSLKEMGFPERLYGADLGLGKLTSNPDYSSSLDKKVQTALEKYLDYDLVNVGWALVRDCPAEFYWFDLSFSYTPFWMYQSHYDSTKKEYYVTIDASFDFYVNEKYQKSGNLFAVNTTKASALKRAVANAKKIVDNAAGYSDVKKLKYYRDVIADLVEYDYEASWRVDDAPYGYGIDGNPWQIINTFDNDPSTNIVCEGYARSFKYLCDETKFDHANIQCYYVTGWLSGEYMDPGAHSWNVVHMSDGYNYLVDLTSYDKGYGVYDPDSYMASQIRGDYNTKYTILSNDSEWYYEYDDLTKKVFSEAVLSLAKRKFDPENVELPKLDPPVLESVVNKKVGVVFTWEAVAGAEKYRVFRKVPGGKWTRIGLTTENTFTDTTVVSGETYYYTVRCTDLTESVYTSYHDEVGLKITYYSNPELSGIKNTYYGPNISWKAVQGAVKYHVLRKEGSGSWKKVGTTDQTEYADKTAVSGKNYSYTVRCCDENGKAASSYSTKGLSIRYIAAPKLVSATNSKDGVLFKWEASEGAARYRVLRKEGSGSYKSIGITSGTSYTDKTAVSGHTYTYTARCIEANSTTYTSGYNSSGRKTKYIAVVKLSKVTNATNGIKLTWVASPGAEKYRVYRRVPGGTWKKMYDASSTSYINSKDIESGKTYEYTVRCVSADGTKLTSAFSDTYLSIVRK